MSQYTVVTNDDYPEFDNNGQATMYVEDMPNDNWETEEYTEMPRSSSTMTRRVTSRTESVTPYQNGTMTRQTRSNQDMDAPSKTTRWYDRGAKWVKKPLVRTAMIVAGVGLLAAIMYWIFISRRKCAKSSDCEKAWWNRTSCVAGKCEKQETALKNKVAEQIDAIETAPAMLPAPVGTMYAPVPVATGAAPLVVDDNAQNYYQDLKKYYTGLGNYSTPIVNTEGSTTGWEVKLPASDWHVALEKNAAASTATV